MVSLNSILNPAPVADSPASDSQLPHSPSSSPTSTTSSDAKVPRVRSLSFNKSLALPPPADSNMMDKATARPYVFSRRTIRDSPIDPVDTRMGSSKGALVSRTRPRGQIKYPPFENLDAASLREVQRFSVYPFGRIAECCAHIPYNSGKKDFFEKTGRESFEVFKYVFKMPGKDAEYTVMWDYNIGLVRLTPFFKSCNYGKTQPAKMLNQNPGLKDISHSITGGSITAQGYWMPWTCAKAVCATFCYKIAGGLIPLFGPDFPSKCIHPDASDFGHMAISHAIVQEATMVAERYRREQHAAAMSANSTLHPPLRSPDSPSSQRRPRSSRNMPVRGAYMRRDYGLDLIVHRGGDSPYMTDDGGGIPASAGSSSSSSRRVYLHSPPRMLPPLPAPRTSAWTPVNRHFAREDGNTHSGGHLGDPYLSAVPRRLPSPAMSPVPTTPVPTLPHLSHRTEQRPSYTLYERPSGNAFATNHHHSPSYPPQPALPLPRLPSLRHPGSPTWPHGSPPGTTKRRFDHDGDLLNHNRLLPCPPPTSDMRGSDESGRQPADAEQDRVAALQLLKLGLLDKLREERLRERREKELRAASSSPQQRGLKEKSTNGRVGGGGGGGASDNHEEESERCIKTDMERCAERAMAIVESHRQKRRRASSEGEIDDRAVVLAAPREQVV